MNTNASKGDGYGVLPTPLRINAKPGIRGRWITICFINIGFYPHPNIQKRILLKHNITGPKRSKKYFMEANENAWYGTMTSVVYARDLKFSRGVYRGNASGASLVISKVTDENGHVSGATITKA